MREMMSLSLLFVGLSLLGSTLAYCPNECSSPNGVCSPAEVCQCIRGWAGDDCSVPDLELRNQEAIETDVATRKWRYFHILANSEQQSVKIEVNQTGNGGDLDAYVRADQYPTRQSYDYRDISTTRDMKFEIPSPHGVYYVGVYGFLGADFTIMATLKTRCPNDCTGHGVCSSNGVCTCREGYIGNDCSVRVFSLNAGEEASGSMSEEGEWRYYRLENSHNLIQVTLSVENEDQNADMYVKYDDNNDNNNNNFHDVLPSPSNYNYRDRTTTQSSTIRIGGAQEGVYYIGVVSVAGDPGVSFTLLADSRSECPNRCSGSTHGSCNSQMLECVCHGGFSGEWCETKDEELGLNGEIESGFVADRLWNYYHFDTFTSTNVEVTLRELNDGADCDVFIKAGELPTRTSFDYRDITFGKTIKVVVENPAVNAWFVGVYGFSECEYLVTAALSTNCPNDCVDEEHGTCSAEGHCVCNSPWVGDDCSMESVALENGEVVEGGIRAGQWAHYHFEAVPNTQVTIALNEEDTVGALWLHEAVRGTPSLSEFDEADREEESKTHHVVTSVDVEMRVNVGVYATDFGRPGQVFSYRLAVWQATFSALPTE